MTKEYILNFLTTHKQELQNNYALTKKDFFLRNDLKEYLEDNFKLLKN
jgi:hypothetical protein